MTIFQGFSRIIRLSSKVVLASATRRAVPAMVCLLMLAAAGVASAQTSLTTYWVSPCVSQTSQPQCANEPIGSDSYVGTQAAPWLTFAHAAATAGAGDTVIFMDGTYGNTNNVTGTVVDLTNVGTEDAPITFKAQHRGMATLDGGAMGCTGAAGTGAAEYLTLDTASYVVIQGFVIQNTCTAGVWDNNTSSNITLRWNEIRDIGNGLTPSSTDINAFYCGSNASNVLLDGNSIHDIGVTPNSTYWNEDSGLNISCQNVTIINNIFYNQSDGWDVQVVGPGSSGENGAQNILIANNTFGPLDPNNYSPSTDIYLDGEVSVWNGGGSATISGLTIENNIFWALRDNAQYNGITTAILGTNPGTSSTSCLVDGNLVTLGDLTNGDFFYRSDSSTCAEGPHNLTDTNTTNPILYAPTYPPSSTFNGSTPNGFDIPPVPNPNPNRITASPAIGAGVTVGGVNSDFAERCRPQMGGGQTGSGYDIGAFQYHGTQTCE